MVEPRLGSHVSQVSLAAPLELRLAHVYLLAHVDRSAGRATEAHAAAAKVAATWYRHQGIYGYSKEFLLQYVRWEPTPLELTEQLEQLRALENGATIAVVLAEDDAIGVDTPEQADEVARLIEQRATMTEGNPS